MALSVLKKSLREEFLLKRSLISVADSKERGFLIEEYLLSLPEFTDAKRVALYADVRGEVRTDEIFKSCLSRGKEIYFPKTDSVGKRIFFYKVEAQEHLTPGHCGILEPEGRGARIDPNELDLIIVPGIVFDRIGGRIGYGKGFYDYELTGVSSTKIALAFHMQVMDIALPTEPHDVKMDMLITERGIERF